MKGILILEITTSVPIEMLTDKENIRIQVENSGMSWNPEIDQVHFMESIPEQKSPDEKKAVGLTHVRRAINTPFNMGMGLDMSLVGGD